MPSTPSGMPSMPSSVPSTPSSQSGDVAGSPVETEHSRGNLRTPAEGAEGESGDDAMPPSSESPFPAKDGSKTACRQGRRVR